MSSTLFIIVSIPMSSTMTIPDLHHQNNCHQYCNHDDTDCHRCATEVDNDGYVVDNDIIVIDINTNINIPIFYHNHIHHPRHNNCHQYCCNHRCATEVDNDGYVVDNAWGDCLDGCPGTRMYFDEDYEKNMIILLIICHVVEYIK